jgi:excisionase family DNA binding protein
MSVGQISHGAPLARAVVAALNADPQALVDLQHLIELRAAERESAPAYTVATLAAALCVSPKVIRNAIARGELEATKRGRRWLVSADAVAHWAGGTPKPTARPRAASARGHGHRLLRDSYANATRP